MSASFLHERRAGVLLHPTSLPSGRLDEDAEIYAALVTGLRDYVHKNGFRDVAIGLSGGIDSALTAAIAVDALGPDAVRGITMLDRDSMRLVPLGSFAAAAAAGVAVVEATRRRPPARTAAPGARVPCVRWAGAFR